MTSTTPTFTFPSFGDFELPKLPVCDNLELPSFEDVTKAVRDAAYVGIGAAVLVTERAQALATDVAKQVSELVQSGIDQVRTATSR